MDYYLQRWGRYVFRMHRKHNNEDEKNVMSECEDAGAK